MKLPNSIKCNLVVHICMNNCEANLISTAKRFEILMTLRFILCDAVSWGTHNHFRGTGFLPLQDAVRYMGVLQRKDDWLRPGLLFTFCYSFFPLTLTLYRFYFFEKTTHFKAVRFLWLACGPSQYSLHQVTVFVCLVLVFPADGDNSLLHSFGTSPPHDKVPHPGRLQL